MRVQAGTRNTAPAEHYCDATMIIGPQLPAEMRQLKTGFTLKVAKLQEIGDFQSEPRTYSYIKKGHVSLL